MAVAAIAITAYVLRNRYYSNSKIPAGHYIGNVYVGELSRQEAVILLSTAEADEVATIPLAFIAEDNKHMTRFEFKPSQAGAVIDAPSSVDELMTLSGKEGYLAKIYYKLSKSERIIQPRLTIRNELALKQLMSQISARVNRAAREARFQVNPSGKSYSVVIVPDRTGREVMSDESEALLKKSLEMGNYNAPLVMEKQYPKVTSAMLSRIPGPRVISSFTTYYGSHDSPNRIHNIQLVASFIDNTFIASGDSFALLKPIGEFTEERGFKEAYVIIGDELVPELGGGTCQIATTLYNAVMLADLDVLKRANHGIYFSIYPLGRDATVYPPYTDFKFRNNTGHPVVINANATKKSLTFRVFGAPTGKTVSFSYPKATYVMKKVMTAEAGTGKMVEKEIQAGPFSTLVTRYVRLNGRLIKQEKIKSSYKLHGDKQNVKIKRKEPR